MNFDELLVANPMPPSPRESPRSWRRAGTLRGKKVEHIVLSADSRELHVEYTDRIRARH